MKILVQDAAFDAGAELNDFTKAQSNMGAVVSFTGIVRDLDAGLKQMDIEHYPGMTERALEKIASDAMGRWNLGDVLVIHRFGALKPEDVIMMVATASKHRKDAFEAADFPDGFPQIARAFLEERTNRCGAGLGQFKAGR